MKKTRAYANKYGIICVLFKISKFERIYNVREGEGGDEEFGGKKTTFFFEVFC